MIHIWHEDSTSSATTSFWQFLSRNKVYPLLNIIDIQGFNGNNRLADAVRTAKFVKSDTYIILADMVLDNAKALKYYLDIKKSISNYKNVYLAKLLSFEYMMLRFKHIITWTERDKHIKSYDEAALVRDRFIQCIDNGLSWTNDNLIVSFVIKYKSIDTSRVDWRSELNYISSEKVATLILSLLTNGGNREFGIRKTLLGDCWTCNCCVRHFANDTVANKSCKLYRYKKSSKDKANNLWNGTLAKQIVYRACKQK